MATYTATDTNFDELVSQGLVLVDFWAPWCGPYSMMIPVLEEVDKEFGDQLSIVKINVDELGQFATRYGVMSIPTLILCKDGEIVERIVGLQSTQVLMELLSPHL